VRRIIDGRAYNIEPRTTKSDTRVAMIAASLATANSATLLSRDRNSRGSRFAEDSAVATARHIGGRSNVRVSRLNCS